jgi:hypothetical protein
MSIANSKGETRKSREVESVISIKRFKKLEQGCQRLSLWRKTPDLKKVQKKWRGRIMLSIVT